MLNQVMTVPVLCDYTGKTVEMTVYPFQRKALDRVTSYLADIKTKRGANRILQVCWDEIDGFYGLTVITPAYRSKRLAGKSRVRYTAQTVCQDLMSGDLKGFGIAHCDYIA